MMRLVRPVLRLYWKLGDLGRAVVFCCELGLGVACLLVCFACPLAWPLLLLAALRRPDPPDAFWAEYARAKQRTDDRPA